MKYAAAFFLLAMGLCGCAGNPLETSNITADGRLYRGSEPTESGESRTTVNWRAAEF